MKATPKTDECIKMLKEAREAFAVLHYRTRDCRFEDYYKGMIKERVDYQNRIMAMLSYRLLPDFEFNIPDRASKEDVRAAYPVLKCISNFDDFWYAMKNYPLVTADDLRNEFLENFPDMERIQKSLDFIRVKFDEVNYYYDDNDINKYFSVFAEFAENKIISNSEYFNMYWCVKSLAEQYNSQTDRIKDIYRSLADAAAKPQQTDTEKPQITFTDYLHHSNKEALMKKLHELLNGQSKAKDVAITITALTELAFIANYGSKNNLYSVMKKEFNLTCSNQGLNNFINSNNRKLTENDTNPTKEILNLPKIRKPKIL